MTSKSDKIVNLNRYRQEKEIEETILDGLMDLSEDGFDDLYDELAFGNSDTELREGHVVFDRIMYLEEALDEGELHWKSDEIFYLSQKMELAMLYKQNGLYHKALEQLLQIYRQSSNDSLGSRYEIMSLYVIKSDYDLAESFFKEHVNNENDVLMQFPMMVASILVGKDDIAQEMINNLSAKVKGFRDFCQQLQLPISKIIDSGSLEKYRANSMESVYLASYNILPLLMTAQNYIQIYLNNFFSEDEVFLRDLSCLSDAQLQILDGYDVIYLIDIEEWTEKELLDLPKFGKATLKKLKEAGVRFSQE